MKKLVLLCVLASFMACSDNDTTYSVAPELDPFVESFYAAGAARGVDVPRNLVAEITENKTQATTKAFKEHDQNYFYYDRIVFGVHKNAGNDLVIESIVYHDLAGLLMKRHIVIPDLSDSNREAYFDQIFK